MYEILHPITNKPCAMPTWGWRYSKERMNELIAQGRIRFGKDETKIPDLKVYLEEVDFPLRSVIDDIDARTGSNDLEALFGTRDKFKNPKPVALIERILDYSTKPDSLILDAFAGSGTTAEAIMRLNHRDGGNRRFILIEDGQGPDNFTRTLTGERVKRAITKYHYQSGFTFYTTDRKLDREAILGLERDSLANLICQADETGIGKGITRLNGYKYIIGKNHRGEAICLVWNGKVENEVTETHLFEAAKEVAGAELREPFRIYGSFCRVQDTPYWKFCQIPDEILVQMHIKEDVEVED